MLHRIFSAAFDCLTTSKPLLLGFWDEAGSLCMESDMGDPVSITTLALLCQDMLLMQCWE